VTNAPEIALTPNLKNVEVTVQNKLHYCRKFSGQNLSMENQQWAKTSKVRCLELHVCFLCTALLLNESDMPTKFQVGSLNTFLVILRTKFKNENEQRAITSKIWSFELWFLCNALLLNEIYLPMKFHVCALHSFNVILQAKKGTGGQTDGRVDYYMPPFGGIKRSEHNTSTSTHPLINCVY